MLDTLTHKGRHQALLDVLAGPGQLHADLPTKLAEVRAQLAQPR